MHGIIAITEVLEIDSSSILSDTGQMFEEKGRSYLPHIRNIFSHVGVYICLYVCVNVRASPKLLNYLD